MVQAIQSELMVQQKHFSTHDICTTDTTYRLGLRNVIFGSAQTTLKTLIEILENINVVQKECDLSVILAKNIASIKIRSERLLYEVLAH